MILDTNALSAWADGDAGIREPLESANRLLIPSVTLGEYWFGILQSRKRQRYESWLAAHLPSVEIALIGYQTARNYAQIRVELKQAGTPIPVHDTWIAALARQHNQPVLSNDSHFDLVPRLQRIGW